MKHAQITCSRHDQSMGGEDLRCQGMADMIQSMGGYLVFCFFFHPVSLLLGSLTLFPVSMFTHPSSNLHHNQKPSWGCVRWLVQCADTCDNTNKSCFKYLQQKVGTSGHKIDQLLKAEHKRCHFTQHKTLKKICQ